MSTHDCNCLECHAIERKRLKELIRQQLWLKDLLTLGQWTAIEEAIDNQKESK